MNRLERLSLMTRIDFGKPIEEEQATKARRLFNRLRADVRNGRYTSGDDTTDFCLLAAYGKFDDMRHDPAVYKRCARIMRDYERELRAHASEYVLIETWDGDACGRIRTPPLILGRSDSSIRINTGGLIVLVDLYTHTRLVWERLEEDIEVWSNGWECLYRAGDSLERGAPILNDEDLEGIVRATRIGNDRVKRYLGDDGYEQMRELVIDPAQLRLPMRREDYRHNRRLAARLSSRPRA